MQFVILTGMSGAGKSTVLKIFEDLGFFCVDNLPPALIPRFAEVIFGSDSNITKVALGIDARGGKLFNDLFAGLAAINGIYEYSILFLDASDNVLVKRYSETRHTHPLAKNDRVITGISMERELLREVKSKATHIIDTTQILARQLKELITEIYMNSRDFNSLMITVLSFGFKYGIPDDADLVFDVRFIPNPFYEPLLKELTGLDRPVRDYVFNCAETTTFLDKLTDMLKFLLPCYITEGKNRLVIAIGCTGGKHRSVSISEDLHMRLNDTGYSVNIRHRDITKG